MLRRKIICTILLLTLFTNVFAYLNYPAHQIANEEYLTAIDFIESYVPSDSDVFAAAIAAANEYILFLLFKDYS